MIHVLQRPDFSLFVKLRESDVTYGQVRWPILRICALHLPIQSAHTHTHTHREHTDGAVGSHLCSWGFDGLLKGTSVVLLKVERVLYIHSPRLQFLPARDSNPQPLGYKSDSLPLGHDLNCNVNSVEAVLWYHGYTIVHKGYNNKSTPINRN